MSFRFPTEAAPEEWVFLNRDHIIGDVDGDGGVGLEDAILSQKISANVDFSMPIYLEADVDDDGIIGLPEAVFSLQSAAGFMPYLNHAGFCPDGFFCIRNPLPTVNAFYDAIYAEGTYVLVGDSGTTFVSSRRATAGLTNSGTIENLFAITHGNDRFVAVGNDGTVVLSQDGITWTASQLSEAEGVGLRGAAFGNNTFICSGGGSVFYSTDNGLTWQGSQIVDPANYYLSGAIYANNLFVVVGSDGKIFTSENGIGWTERHVPEGGVNPDFRHIAYGDEGYIAADSYGVIYKSSDAITWEGPFYVGEHVDDLAFGNGIYATVNRTGYITTSEDAMTWNEQENTFLLRLHSISFANGKFIATGESGRIYESTDGINWDELSEKVTYENFTYVAFGNNKFIASEDGGSLCMSQDGKVWSRSPNEFPAGSVKDLKFINGKFYILSGDKIFSSQDGHAWDSVVLPCNGHQLIYANELYVILGSQPMIIVSPDALEWSEVWNGSDDDILYGIGYGNNKFVVSLKSDAYYIITSDDGSFWTNGTEIEYPLVSFSYGNDLFVAASAYGRIYSSSDGITWENQVPGTNTTVSSVMFNEDGFAAVGYYSRTVPWGAEWFGLIYTSPDGDAWTPTFLQLPTLTGMAEGQNSYVLVGCCGTILQWSVAEAPFSK
jgi:photosystem II stability/assembly factor-like uncharacterized protein